MTSAADLPKKDSTTVFQQQAQFLEEAGAQRFPHAHSRSLLEHLLGTRSILIAWGQPVLLQRAGLFHSVYSTDVYRRELLSRSFDRGKLIDLIGPAAERVVYLFSTVPRKRMFQELMKRRGIPANGLEMAIGGPKPSVVLSAQEAAWLIVLHIANEAEQVQDSASGAPGLWLSRASRRAELLKPDLVRVPPIFADCTALVAKSDEATHRNSYLAGLDRVRLDISGARGLFAECCALIPWLAEPLIRLAQTMIETGDAEQSRPILERARELLASWGTPWDKRLTYGQWQAIIQRLLV
jgi:hypothetical protein